MTKREIGWAAVAGDVSLAPVILFLLIFMWTPPHFWALALCRSDDYARAGVPMLPVVAGPDETRRQIWIYSLLLVPVTLVPWILGTAGRAYLVTAIAAGAVFLGAAWQVYRVRAGDAAIHRARRLFGVSIAYLFILFAVLLGEHAIVRLLGGGA